MRRWTVALAVFALGLGSLAATGEPAQAASGPAWAWQSSPSPAFGNVNVNATLTKTYTLANTGGSATGSMKVSLVSASSSPSAFTITRDSCSATSLRAKKSCTVDVTYAPDAGWASSVTLKASTKKPTSPATLTLTGTGIVPNRDPVANDDSYSTAEDTPLAGDVLTNDTDPDGDPLTVTDCGSAAHGSAVVGADGSFSYTPDANYTGPDSFTYTVSDGRGGTSVGTVNVRVTPVNDAPIASDDPEPDAAAFTTAQGTALTLTPASLLANDTDIETDTLTVTSVQDATHGTVALVDGSPVFTPDFDFNGPASFTYTISDGNGGTDTATVSLTVTPVVNDPPVANDDSFSTAEDTPLAGDVLTNDTDPDGDPLTVTDCGSAAHGSAVVGADGSFSYTPDANYYNGPDSDYDGLDSFTYTISDGRGGTSIGTVNVTVTPVNDAPSAVDDPERQGIFASIPINTARSLTTDSLLANDTDIDRDNLRVTSVQDATHGTVVLSFDERYDDVARFTPDADYTGAASFTYTIDDSNGGTDTATVYLLVYQDNLPPVANDDSYFMAQDTGLTGHLLTNDSDPNGDPLTVTEYNGEPLTDTEYLGRANWGEVFLFSDGTFYYTPDANYTGPDSFTYTISDGRGGTSVGTVNVTVTPVNDAP